MRRYREKRIYLPRRWATSQENEDEQDMNECACGHEEEIRIPARPFFAVNKKLI